MKLKEKPLEERIEKLEKLYSIEEIEEEMYLKENKKPHKCPVCDGKKKNSEITKASSKLHDDLDCKKLNPHSVWNMCMTCKGAFYHEYEDCIICEGTGIVWG